MRQGGRCRNYQTHHLAPCSKPSGGSPTHQGKSPSPCNLQRRVRPAQLLYPFPLSVCCSLPSLITPLQLHELPLSLEHAKPVLVAEPLPFPRPGPTSPSMSARPSHLLPAGPFKVPLISKAFSDCCAHLHPSPPRQHSSSASCLRRTHCHLTH